MKLFRTYTFKWWQVSLFKIHLISLGILGGIYFTEFFKQATNLFISIVVILSIYFIYSVFAQKI